MISALGNRKPNLNWFKQKGFILCNQKSRVWQVSGLTSRTQAPPSFVLCHPQLTGLVLSAVSLQSPYSCHSSRSQVHTQRCQTESTHAFPPKVSSCLLLHVKPSKNLVALNNSWLFSLIILWADWTQLGISGGSRMAPSGSCLGLESSERFRGWVFLKTVSLLTHLVLRTLRRDFSL